MMNSTALMLGLLLGQAPASDDAPQPIVTERPAEAPVAPLPSTSPVAPQSENQLPPPREALTPREILNQAREAGSETPAAGDETVLDGAPAEEVNPLERRGQRPNGLPHAWGWDIRAAADGWYPSTRDIKPYVEPNFGRKYRPYYSWGHWWHSPGDMIQHFAYYPTLHGYYYARPYHTMQIPHHSSLAQGYSTDPRNPYDNKIFEKVYESLAKEKAESGGGESEGGESEGGESKGGESKGDGAGSLDLERPM